MEMYNKVIILIMLGHFPANLLTNSETLMQSEWLLCNKAGYTWGLSPKPTCRSQWPQSSHNLFSGWWTHSLHWINSLCPGDAMCLVSSLGDLVNNGPGIAMTWISYNWQSTDVHWHQFQHYSDVIMGAMASEITCFTIVLLNRLSKKTSKLRVTGLCAGNSSVTGEFPAQMASSAENVSIWWWHHGVVLAVTKQLYEGSCPSVRHTLFTMLLSSYHLITIDKSDVQTKRQGRGYQNKFCPNFGISGS